jgi:hypothetical protein
LHYNAGHIGLFPKLPDIWYPNWNLAVLHEATWRRKMHNQIIAKQFVESIATTLT